MSEARCWRCARKLFEVLVPFGAMIPKGVGIKQPCPRCQAMNVVELDSLAQRTVVLP